MIGPISPYSLAICLMVVASSWMLIRQGLRLWKALQMKRWPEVEARIVRAEMRRLGRKGDEGCSLFDPVVSYTYSVGGLDYQGHLVSTEISHGILSKAAQVVTAYQNGSLNTTKAFYHPQRPDLAVLVPLPWKTAAGQALLYTVGLAVAATLLLS